MYRYFFKYFIDFSISLVGLICISPVFILITIFLFITNSGKPFFFQSRPGKNARIFKVIKFKTMNDKKDEEGNLLPDAERLTPVGKFVRKTSLDEIPQLINVLKGDMSLVGPRPLLVEYLPLYNKEQARRHEVRPGKNAQVFKVIKFKTMNDKKDEEGNLLQDAERLTPVGKFVRKTSLDEIPQLINVLKGDMSLVGPRPLLMEYLPLYNKEQARRHEVCPGITGWAQVNGRNAISWLQKFEYDVWYVDHISFLLDVKILWMTIIKVFKSEGISSTTSATMEKFIGN